MTISTWFDRASLYNHVDWKGCKINSTNKLISIYILICYEYHFWNNDKNGIVFDVFVQVFHGCGRPEPGNQRGKREAAAAAASSYDEYDMFERTKYVKPTTAAGTSLDRLVRDIKEKVCIECTKIPCLPVRLSVHKWNNVRLLSDE